MGTRYPGPDIRYLLSGTRYLVPVPGTGNQYLNSAPATCHIISWCLGCTATRRPRGSKTILFVSALQTMPGLSMRTLRMSPQSLPQHQIHDMFKRSVLDSNGSTTICPSVSSPPRLPKVCRGVYRSAPSGRCFT